MRFYEIFENTIFWNDIWSRVCYDFDWMSWLNLCYDLMPDEKPGKISNSILDWRINSFSRKIR